jgi:uncharacterized flavoprotein (TIGR03862 family)
MTDAVKKTVAVIGGGPAGLMAAEVMAEAGLSVGIFDRMPSIGRKFLLAGRGGLNLTHSEPFQRFLGRYGSAREALDPAIEAFPPDRVRAWAAGLGEDTFIGSSGRVFPTSFKASPLLRAWLVKLVGLGVTIRSRLRWTGFTPSGAATFVAQDGAEISVEADAVVLALGGASWPRLGSDGGWVPSLRRAGVTVTPLVPANCGFQVAWSDVFRDRYQGEPLKRVCLDFAGRSVKGEAVVTAEGIEGGVVYAHSAAIRDSIGATGRAIIQLDLKPGMSQDELTSVLSRTRPGDSVSNRLRKAAGLPPVAIGLLREAVGKDLPADPRRLAQAIKAVPLTLTGVRPLDRAISTAGGIDLAELDDHFMLRRLPGVFAAGEMLDWEAPTGGYLLQAAFATGAAAGRGVVSYLANR